MRRSSMTPRQILEEMFNKGHKGHFIPNEYGKAKIDEALTSLRQWIEEHKNPYDAISDPIHYQVFQQTLKDLQERIK